MRLAAEFFREEPVTELTMEDRIAHEKTYGNVVEGEQKLEFLYAQEEMILNGIRTMESFQGALEASLEDDSVNVKALEQSFRLTLESLFGKDHPYVETEFSQEGIGELVGKLVQAASNAAGRITRSIKDTLSEMRGGHKDLDKRLTVLKTKLSQIPNDQKPKKTEIKVGGGSRLHIEGSIDGPVLAKEYPRAAGVVTKYNRTLVGFAEALFDHVAAAQKQIAGLDKKADADAIEAIQKKTKKESDAIVAKFNSAVSGIDKQPLPGGQQIRVYDLIGYTTVDSDGKKDKGGFAFFEDNNGFGEYKEKDAIETPTLKEVEVIMEAAKTISQAAVKEMKNVEDLAVRAEVMKAAAKNSGKLKESLFSIHNINKGVLEYMFTNYFGNNLKRWASNLEESMIYLNVYQFQTARAAIDYCEKSVNQYFRSK